MITVFFGVLALVFAVLFLVSYAALQACIAKAEELWHDLQREWERGLTHIDYAQERAKTLGAHKSECKSVAKAVGLEQVATRATIDRLKQFYIDHCSREWVHIFDYIGHQTTRSHAQKEWMEFQRRRVESQATVNIGDEATAVVDEFLVKYLPPETKTETE